MKLGNIFLSTMLSILVLTETDITDAATTQGTIQENSVHAVTDIDPSSPAAPPETTVGTRIYTNNNVDFLPYIVGNTKNAYPCSTTFGTTVSGLYTVKGFPTGGSATLYISSDKIFFTMLPMLKESDLTLVARVGNEDIVRLEKDKKYLFITSYGIDKDCMIKFKFRGNRTKSARNGQVNSDS